VGGGEERTRLGRLVISGQGVKADSTPGSKSRAGHREGVSGKSREKNRKPQIQCVVI